MKAAAAVSKTPLVLALRDSLTGKEVEVPLDAKGKPDFFVARAKLRALQSQSSAQKAEPAPDKKLLAAEAELKSAKADYFKSDKECRTALAAYELAKVDTAKAKDAKAKPAVLTKLDAVEKKAREKWQSADAKRGAYRKGYEFSKEAYEKLVKARHRAPAYDYATASFRAFGAKYPKQYGATLLVLIPAKVSATALPEKIAVKPTVKSATPKIKPAAAKSSVATPAPKSSALPPPSPPAPKPSHAPAPAPKPVAPTPKPVAVKPPLKPAATPSPQVAAAPAPKIAATPPPPKPVENKSETAKPASPGLSKENPIPYSKSEVVDGNIVIHTADGKTVKFPQASSEYQTHGGGLGSIKTAAGHVFWFRYVPPVEDLGGDTAPKISAKPEAPVMPKAPEPAPTKIEVPVAAKTETPAAPASSGPTAFTGLSDAEAADYTLPVSGYPVAKAPMYVWQHKTKKEYLAVINGKRMKLNEAQFYSLDKGVHPEFYSEAPVAATPLPTTSISTTPVPKTPVAAAPGPTPKVSAPKPSTTTPDF